MKLVTSIFAPKAVWPYSQWVVIRKTLYTSGQIWMIPEKKKLEEWINAQTERVCKNLWEVLKEAWYEFKEVVKTTIFITDMESYWTVNKIYEKYFNHKPARSCIGVASLPAWALIEIEVIAKHF